MTATARVKARAANSGTIATAVEGDWARSYAIRVAVTDMIVITWAVVGTQIAWFGTLDTNLNLAKYRGGFGLSYTLISIILIVSWIIVLAAFATRDVRVIGTGPTEYKRVVDATIRLFGVVAIVAFLFQLDLARGYILMSLPVGLLALLASRWIWRQWLGGQRERGLYSSRVLLLGTRDSVAAIARDLARAPFAGYLVVAACVPGDTFGGSLRGGIPVRNELGDIQKMMHESGADTVIVTSSDELPPERIRELSWSLEPGRQHLVLVPSLTDVGGPRIHMRPVAGLPLIHVETPSNDGLKRLSKRSFDIAASVMLIIILSPVLLIIGMCVRLSTPGNVFFRQRRVGLDGKQFEMLKFRSMTADAEQRLNEVRQFQGAEGNTVLFKMKNDPRVTPIGRFLRRFSLDELPQLFNVVAGTMSLVGPRPPLEREVQEYENHVHRRFLVKPGVTGLWQVSGRSNLSWEDSVRLDLYYVENWSMTGDFVILWRTLKAVVAKDGAY